MALAGCGGDDDEDSTVTVIERTVVETTPAPEPETEPAGESCGDVSIEANSGNGAFDVEVTGISCADAASLLRSDTGLATFDCKSIEVFEAGNERFRCRDGDQEIVFTTGL